jgi:hypothetical protein
MHQIDDAVVRDGKIVLSDLPFADGQHVRVIVAERELDAMRRIPIADVRRQLKGGVERFEEPFEPMIPSGDWEMLK